MVRSGFSRRILASRSSSDPSVPPDKSPCFDFADESFVGTNIMYYVGCGVQSASECRGAGGGGAGSNCIPLLHVDCSTLIDAQVVA